MYTTLVHFYDMYTLLVHLTVVYVPIFGSQKSNEKGKYTKFLIKENLCIHF